MSLRDSIITNFGNGVTNRGDDDLYQAMAQLDPTRHHNYMDDFEVG